MSRTLCISLLASSTSNQLTNPFIYLPPSFNHQTKLSCTVISGSAPYQNPDNSAELIDLDLTGYDCLSNLQLGTVDVYEPFEEVNAPSPDGRPVQIGLYDANLDELPEVPAVCNVEAEYTFKICNKNEDAPLMLDEVDTVLAVDGGDVTMSVTPSLFATAIEPEVCSKHTYVKTINLCERPPADSGLPLAVKYDVTMTVSGEELCIDESSKGGKGKGKGGKSCKGKGGKGKGGKGKGSDSKGGKGKGGKSSKSKGNSKGYSRNLKSSKGKGKGGSSFECKFDRCLAFHIFQSNILTFNLSFRLSISCDCI